MQSLYWQTSGQKKPHLILLHGWGLNAQIWHNIITPLSAHFSVHQVDLPGFGRSTGFGPLTLAQMTDCLLRQAPPQAIWLGWSLGGLLASHIAIHHPERVQALITVASSPCFMAKDASTTEKTAQTTDNALNPPDHPALQQTEAAPNNAITQPPWPGIAPETLTQFQQQLNQNYQHTVERFLALQTLGSQSARQDLRALQQAIFGLPAPEPAVLNSGLEILKTTDLRQPLAQITAPFLRLYGKLDALIPRRVAQRLDQALPQSQSITIDKAAHAPFISHPEEFLDNVIEFCT